MFKYTDYEDNVRLLITDKSLQLKDGDTAKAINRAVYLYSAYEPRLMVYEYTSDGGRLYDLPPDWNQNLSESYKVEYPVDDTLQQPAFLVRAQTMIYPVFVSPVSGVAQSPKLRLRFTATVPDDIVPASGKIFHLHYPIIHTLSETGNKNTIPDSHYEAVCKLAARELCLILSSRLAQQASGLAGSDAADYRDKSDKMQKLADIYYNDFKDFIVPKPEATKAAGAFGRFREDAQNSDYIPTFPRDSSGRLIV